MAEIQPHAQKEYTFRQSPLAARGYVPELPVRAVCLAPSGGGKTTLMVAQLLQPNLFRGCFRRIYVFSPSAFLDDSWKPVLEYAKSELEQDPDEEPILHDRWSEGRLQQILQKHRRIVELQKKAAAEKKKGPVRLFGAALICDDFADNPQVCRGSGSLHELFVRGRHYGISTWVLTQKLRAIAPIIRVNATDYFVFRLRSEHEVAAIIEEYGGIWGRDATMRILLHATAQPYGFLWINARAKRSEDFFWQGFTGARLVPRGRAATSRGAGGRPGSADPRLPSSRSAPDPDDE